MALLVSARWNVMPWTASSSRDFLKPRVRATVLTCGPSARRTWFTGRVHTCPAIESARNDPNPVVKSMQMCEICEVDTSTYRVYANHAGYA